MMIANKFEQKAIYAALGLMYESALKVKAREVPINTLILVATKDEHDEEPYYQIFLLWRRTMKEVRCAHYEGDMAVDDYTIGLDDEVVILQPASIKPVVELKKPTARSNEMEEVRIRRTRAMLYCTEGRRYYITDVRHDKKTGRPTSGVIENGGWRMRIDPRGDVRCGRNNEVMFNLSPFSVFYVPESISKKARSYEDVFEWADNVPKEFHIQFDLTKV